MSIELVLALLFSGALSARLLYNFYHYLKGDDWLVELARSLSVEVTREGKTFTFQYRHLHLTIKPGAIEVRPIDGSFSGIIFATGYHESITRPLDVLKTGDKKFDTRVSIDNQSTAPWMIQFSTAMKKKVLEIGGAMYCCKTYLAWYGRPGEAITHKLIDLAMELVESDFREKAQANLKDPDPQIRLVALKYLAEGQKRTDETTILGCWNDPDEKVRTFLIQSLEGRKTSEPEQQTLHRLLEDPVPELRMRAAHLLDAAAIPFLMKSLNDPDCAEAAVDRLLALKASGLLERFHDLLERQSRPHTLKAVIRGLGIMGDPRSGKLLAAAVTQIEDSDHLAAVTIETFKQLRSTSGEPFLLDLLENRSLRLEAVRALAVCGTGTSLGILHRLLDQRPDMQLKLSLDHTIASIENRCGKIEKGWLSLDQAETGGGLSLLEPGEQGHLSLSPRDEHETE